MYMARDLSKYIVTRCYENGNPITNLQLQKILYYIQRDYLQRTGGIPAFDDRIEAWRFGPVVPNVYYDFCEFGAMPITMSYSNANDMISPRDRGWMDELIMERANQNPWELVSDTHRSDGPWAQVYRQGEPHIVIPPELILEKG